MPYSLKDRNVLITGGSRGLGAEVAAKFVREGCNVVVNYNDREGPAAELAKKLMSEVPGSKVGIIQGNAGETKDCERMVKQTVENLGGLDIIVSNAGWTRFSEFGDLNSMSDDEWDKCWAVNVRGQMAMLRAALPTFNSNPDGGHFIMTSSIAGISCGGSSMPYSVTKAAGLHLMKCMAKTQGPKVRVNAVLPGLLMTEWGQQFSEERVKTLKGAASLKTDTNLEDCANAFIMLAKNTSISGAEIKVDAGLAF